MSHASRRLQQIENELEELAELAITPGLNGIQRNKIANDMRELMAEKERLEAGNHYLSGTEETKPSLKALTDSVQRDIHQGFTNKKGLL